MNDVFLITFVFVFVLLILIFCWVVLRLHRDIGVIKAMNCNECKKRTGYMRVNKNIFYDLLDILCLGYVNFPIQFYDLSMKKEGHPSRICCYTYINKDGICSVKKSEGDG